MGTSFSSKINNKKKANKASLQIPQKESSDFIPFLPKANKENYIYAKKSKLTNSGRVYELEKYDYFHNLSKRKTQGLENYQLREIKYEDFHTVNNTPIEVNNYGLKQLSFNLEEWRNYSSKFKKTLFMDSEFEPDIQGILGKIKEVDKKSKLTLCLKYPPLVWDRPFIYSLRKMKSISNWEKFQKSGQKNEKIVFFNGDKFRFTDIYEGILPMSHFYGPLICMAKDGKVIEQHVFHEKNDTRGIFGFLFNIKGKWKFEKVDDNLPYFKRTMSLEDLKPQKNQNKSKKMRLDFLSGRPETKIIWPLLMEKAYVKIQGGYMNLARSNDPALVMTDLTGFPTEAKEIIDFSSENFLWNEIYNALEKGNLVCALTIKNSEACEKFKEEFTDFRRKIGKGDYSNHPYVINKNDFMVEYLGLFPQQTYPILSAKLSENRERYVLTMDTRGRLKYKDKKGNSSMSNYCNHDSKILKGKDRIFKIGVDDLSKVFSKVFICYNQQNVMMTNLTSEFQDNTFSCFSLKFDSKGDYVIRVSQNSHLLDQNFGKVKYPKIQILLARVTVDNDYEYIEGKIERYRDVWMNVQDLDHTQNYNLYVLKITLIHFLDSGFFRKKSKTRNNYLRFRECYC